MPLKITQKPTVDPLDLDELKSHLNLTGTERFDSWLTGAIKASDRPWRETLGITLISSTLQWTMSDFNRKTELPRPPLISVSKVEYRNEDGAWTEVDASNYEVNAEAEPGFVRFSDDYEEPDTYPEEEYPWRFTYKAGYEDSEGKSTWKQIPWELRWRMMAAIGTLFMKREDTVVSNRSSVNVQQMEQAMGRLIRHHNKRVRFG